MLPVLPKRSRRSGAIEAMMGMSLRAVATVATPFINLNKKMCCHDPTPLSVINEVNLVKGVKHAPTLHIQAWREAMHRQVKENESALQ